jgi:hypothetical protein
MAKLKGILKLEGTLDDLTFYKSQDGHLVKTKGGVSRERIANDPAFARTRENGLEFANAAKAGKILRDSVRNLMSMASDNRVTSRLTQTMSKVQKMDTTSARGERTVAIGIDTAEGQALLKNFNFNNKAILGTVLNSPYSVDTATGIITIDDLVPMNEINFPQGSTHVTIVGAYANVDFETGLSAISYTNMENLPLDTGSVSLILEPDGVPTGSGTKFFLLEILFFQEVNGVQYPLKNGAFNSLSIIEVA